jgi:hypothetical protein
MGKTYTTPDVAQYGIPRIPTPPMDLAAVVYVLLHDHLPEAVEQGWPGPLKEALKALPQFSMQPLSHLLKPSAHLDCNCWYLHAGHHAT